MGVAHYTGRWDGSGHRPPSLFGEGAPARSPPARLNARDISILLGLTPETANLELAREQTHNIGTSATTLDSGSAGVVVQVVGFRPSSPGCQKPCGDLRERDSRGTLCR